jgi:hypothetical protein
MAVYTVHAPPLTARAAAQQPERFVFVRDAFSLSALLFGALWMLRYRMWLVLLGYVLVVVVLSLLLSLAGSASAGVVVWALLALLIGFEAPTLRRYTLARSGYRTVGLVVGDDLDLAERRFFDAWAQKETAEGSDPFDAWAQKAVPPAPSNGPEVLGLFPEPGAAR